MLKIKKTDFAAHQLFSIFLVNIQNFYRLIKVHIYEDYTLVF